MRILITVHPHLEPLLGASGPPVARVLTARQLAQRE